MTKEQIPGYLDAVYGPQPIAVDPQEIERIRERTKDMPQTMRRVVKTLLARIDELELRVKEFERLDDERNDEIEGENV